MIAYTEIDRQLDLACAALADARADADRGMAYMRQMEQQWYRQGANAARMGLGDGDLWNRWQVAGYNEAMTVPVVGAMAMGVA